MGRREDEREAKAAARIAEAVGALVQTLTPLTYDERWRALAAIALAFALPRIVDEAGATAADDGGGDEQQET
jgi:hypothetical protein